MKKGIVVAVCIIAAAAAYSRPSDPKSVALRMVNALPNTEGCADYDMDDPMLELPSFGGGPDWILCRGGFAVDARLLENRGGDLTEAQYLDVIQTLRDPVKARRERNAKMSRR